MCVGKNTNNAIMNTLHKSQNGYQNFESREGQRGLLCSNKKPFRCPSLDYKFSEETMDSFNELGAVLRRIHKRLISEGYIIKDGKIIKNENG